MKLCDVLIELYIVSSCCGQASLVPHVHIAWSPAAWPIFISKNINPAWRVTVLCTYMSLNQRRTPSE
jgi:hypothetical protein